MALMLSPSSVLLVIFAALLGCAAGFLQLIVKEKLAGRQITSSDDDELRPRAESSNALLQTPRSPGAVAVEKPQVTNREAKFFHGAMLRELMQKSLLETSASLALRPAGCLPISPEAHSIAGAGHRAPPEPAFGSMSLSWALCPANHHDEAQGL